AAVGSGGRPLDHEQVVVGVDADPLEVADGAAVHTVVAGSALALLGAAETSVAGVRADGAARTVYLFGAVAGRQAGEAVPLHDALEAAALAGADHVHRGDAVEHLAHRQHLADLRGVGGLFVDAELADVQRRFDV